MREKEVGDEHRLRRTEMRVRRHEAVARPRGLRRKRLDEGGHGLLERRDAPPQVQAQIERHLLVTGSSGVQATPGVAEPLDEQPLDEAVHVFVGAGHKVRIRDAQFENLGQRLLDIAVRRRASARRPWRARAPRPGCP